MTTNTKYARLLGATKHYIFLLLLASLFLLAACGGGSNPSANPTLSNLSIADTTAFEYEEVIKFTVNLNATSDSATSFYYRTQNGSATTSDYISVTKKTATVISGDSTTTISITIIDDDEVEDAESFVVEILDSSSNNLLDTATATIKISDLSLAIADASAFENAGRIKFIVSLSAPFPSNKIVDFNYRTQDTGSASSSSDYTSVSNTATIAIGETTTEIFINLIDDTLVEGDETFLVAISTNQLDIPIIKPQATATIKIDDLPSLSITDATAFENAGILTFRASLNESSPNDKIISFDYQTKKGSANNKIVWQQATNSARWSARNRQTSLVFNNRMWVLGGNVIVEGESKYFNDVFYSADGITWREATTDAKWNARQEHSSVVFKSKMWVLGGSDGSDKNDVWYSADGITWREATADAKWNARQGHSSVVFKSKMWVLGGSDGRFKNDVWDSSNGADWSEVTTSNIWNARHSHSSVVFDNKIWVLGGHTGTSQNDVWYSTNGKDWYKAIDKSNWSVRDSHTSVVFGGKIWVLGGSKEFNRNVDYKNGVYYSSNGVNWQRSTAESNWSARSAHSSVVFDNKIWVLGGEQIGTISVNDVYFAYATGDYLSASGSGSILGGERSTTINIKLLDDDILELTDETFDIIISNPLNATIDVSSNHNQATASILAETASWTKASENAAWPARWLHTSVVLDDKIWVLGGYDNIKNKKDIWYSSNGINWSEVTTSNIWSARSSHTSVVFDDKMWVLGGRDNQGNKNDVWESSNGTDWQQASTNNIWSARSNHTSVSFKGEIWMLGGRDNQGNKNDIWHLSRNRTWSNSFIENNIWDIRQNHTSVAYKSRMWVLGGSQFDQPKNNVWYSSSGVSWSEATTDAGWSARSEHSSVVFDDKMWVLGGRDKQGDKNDVWYSTDGRNWNEETTNSIWSARRNHSSVVFKDKIWVLGGRDKQGEKNDVWFLSELDE